MPSFKKEWDTNRNSLLADILLMKTDADISWCRNLVGYHTVKCPECGGKAGALYFDREVYSQFVEEPICKCGWMDTSEKVPYPRGGD